MITWIVGAPLTLWLCLMGLLLWITSRRSARAVWVVSLTGLLCLAALAFDIWHWCATSDCNTPGGSVAYATLYLTLPLAAVGQLLLTSWMTGRASR